MVSVLLLLQRGTVEGNSFARVPLSLSTLHTGLPETIVDTGGRQWVHLDPVPPNFFTLSTYGPSALQLPSNLDIKIYVFLLFLKR